MHVQIQQSAWQSISSIFDNCSNRLITSITAKPYIQHKSFFTQFVQNSLSFNMGIFFYLHPHEGCQRPKTPLRARNWHEGVDLLKKVFNKKCSTTSKPLVSLIRFELTSVQGPSTCSMVLRALTLPFVIGPYCLCLNATLCCCCWKDISNSRIRQKVLISSFV